MQLQLHTQKRPVPGSGDMPVDDQAIIVLLEGVEDITAEQRGMLEDNANKRLRR